jgi:antitoxin component YwqK of YwqJK toxin-antitoxin module
MKYSDLTDNDLKIDALRNPNCSSEIIDKIIMADGFPYEEFNIAWGSEKAEVAKNLIASHKNTKPKQLKKLFEISGVIDDKETKNKILQNPSCDKNLLIEGFRFADRLARNTENKKESASGRKTIQKLLGHPDFPSVRVGIGEGPKWEKIDIYEWFIINVNNDEFIINIAENINCPNEILEKIIHNKDYQTEPDFEAVIEAAIINENYEPTMEIVEGMVLSSDESTAKKGKMIKDTKYPSEIKLLPDIGAPEKLLDVFSLPDLIDFSDGLSDDSLKEWFKEYRYEDDEAVPQGDEYHNGSIIKQVLFPSGLKKSVEIEINGKTFDEEKSEKIKSMKEFDVLIEGELHWSKGLWKTFTYDFSKNTSFDETKLSAVGELGVITDYFYDGNLLKKNKDHDLQDGYSSLTVSIYLNGDIHELNLEELRSELEKAEKDSKDLDNIKEIIISNVKDEVESSKDEKEIFEDGPHKSFFQREGLEGIIQKEGFLKNGQWDGLYKSYHNNGELEFEGYYKEGVRVGRWKKYSRTTPYIENQGFKGGLYDDFGYKDKYEINELKTIADEGLEGLLDGPYTRYYFNRNIEFEGSYKNNKKNGIFKKYSFQGELESETNYNEGDVVD